MLAIQRRRDPNDRSRERKFLYASCAPLICIHRRGNVLKILKNRYGGRLVESDRLEMCFKVRKAGRRLAVS